MHTIYYWSNLLPFNEANKYKINGKKIVSTIEAKSIKEAKQMLGKEITNNCKFKLA